MAFDHSGHIALFNNIGGLHKSTQLFYEKCDKKKGCSKILQGLIMSRVIQHIRATPGTANASLDVIPNSTPSPTSQGFFLQTTGENEVAHGIKGLRRFTPPTMAVEHYDHRREDLNSYISRNGSALFRCLTERVSSMDDGLELGEFLNRMNPFAALYDVPMQSVRTMSSILGRLRSEAHDLLFEPIKNGSDVFETVGAECYTFFRGTGIFNSRALHYDVSDVDAANDRRTRKIYVSPKIDRITEFVIALYADLERDGLTIEQSKIYWSACAIDEQDHLIGQKHNFFCIYVPSDNQIPQILAVIEEAIVSSDIPTAVFDGGNIAATIPALNGRAFLGVDVPNASFGQWTSAVAWSAYSKRQEDKSISVDEAIKRAFFEVTGTTSDTFLNLES